MHRAYIGIGSNLGDSSANLRKAIEALGSLGAVARLSPFYRTKPWGVHDQPDYVNAVALLQTELSPDALLRELKELERRLGRTRSARWGPRVIDLDILTYDNEQIDGPELTIPHPRMHQRAFVLVPLAEIDPAFALLLDALPESERGSVSPL